MQHWKPLEFQRKTIDSDEKRYQLLLQPNHWPEHLDHCESVWSREWFAESFGSQLDLPFFGTWTLPSIGLPLGKFFLGAWKSIISGKGVVRFRQCTMLFWCQITKLPTCQIQVGWFEPHRPDPTQRYRSEGIHGPTPKTGEVVRRRTYS